MTWLHSDIYWIADAFSWCICGLFALFICGFHLLKVIQDICTKERKSLSHRHQKPTRNKVYILITFCSSGAILMYTLSLTIGGLNNFYFMAGGPACRVTPIIITVSWQMAKCGLYLLFLLRLHTVYDDSAYRYSKIKLLIIAIITFCINIIVAILICVLSIPDGPHKHDISHIAIICSVIIPEWLILFSGAYDVVMSCVCLFAFIAPLRKLIHSIPSKGEFVSPQVTRLTYVGLKFLIVTTVAVLSSLIMLSIVAISDAFIVASYDMLINSVCILMMIPYYQDKLYYDRLCFCCVQCCNHGMKKKMQVITNEVNAAKELDVVPSTDTKSQQ